jgi:hypothetical protein
MNIFKTIGKSIYGPDFYSTLVGQGKSLSVKYYFKFLLLLALLATIIFSVVNMPKAFRALTPESVDSLVALYPAELTLTTKDGTFVTNVKEPYQIPMKYQEDAPKKEGEQENFAVIDTKVDAVSLETFKKYDTFVLINKNSVVALKDGSLQMTPVATYFAPGFELNQTSIKSFTVKVLPLVRNMVWLIPVLIYIGFYISGLMTLVLMFVWALLVWLVLLLNRQSKGYSYAYCITIHATTLSLILGVLFTRLPWYVSAIVTLIVILVNLRKPRVPVENVTPVVPVV